MTPESPAAETYARAGGKVILLGEHAVVYGSPAIVVGLKLGAEAHARPDAVASLDLGGQRHELRGGNELRADNAAEPELSRAFRALLGALEAPPARARAELAIPAGAGLGASAALGVAIARAVAGATRSTGAGITAAALAWENVFHGNASGVDTAAAEHGGCLWFQRGVGTTPLSAAAPLRLAIAQVEPGASTRVMVEAVAGRHRADPQGVELRMRAIAQLVERARGALAKGHLGELGELMNDNHELLRALGVSTPRLEQARTMALRAGAFGAKLTGAGGGGCVVALVDDVTRPRVQAAWAAEGLRQLEAID